MEIKLNDFTNTKEDPEALFEILEKLGTHTIYLLSFISI